MHTYMLPLLSNVLIIIFCDDINIEYDDFI